MYYFLPEKDGRVKTLLMPKQGVPVDGYLATESIPPIPTVGEAYTTQLYYIDGELQWKPIEQSVADAEVTLVPSADVSDLRRTAYEVECDPYLTAYLGYTAEGDTEKAESARMAYLRAKAEVRKRLPYSV
jgi:hypothetical protein